MVFFIIVFDNDLLESDIAGVGPWDGADLSDGDEAALFGKDDVVLGVILAFGLVVVLFPDLSLGDSVDVVESHQFVELFGIIPKHHALDLHAGAVHQCHAEDFGQFSALVIEFSIGFFNDSRKDFPPALEADIEIRNLLKLF